MKSLEAIRQRIAETCRQSNRSPDSVRLIAVGKGQPVSKLEALRLAGQIDFGENYGQELTTKANALRNRGIEWHFLGHLQTNKITLLLPHIAWIHSLDSLKLAEGLDKRASRKLNVLLEIRFGNEPEKTGLFPEEALRLLPELNRFQNLEVRGFMTIPPQTASPEKTRSCFYHLFELLKESNSGYQYRSPLTELSMGMSGDFEIAIAEGATMVRIGRSLFGERKV